MNVPALQTPAGAMLNAGKTEHAAQDLQHGSLCGSAVRGSLALSPASYFTWLARSDLFDFLFLIYANPGAPFNEFSISPGPLLHCGSDSVLGSSLIFDTESTPVPR